VNGVVLACLIFCLGLYGVLSRRDIVALLASVEVMMGGATLLLVVLASSYPSVSSIGVTAQGAPAAGPGQAVLILLLAVVAAEAAVGLALLVALARGGRTRMTDIEEVRG
jgi:NADH-quinone oxidoreductase subunit K